MIYTLCLTLKNEMIKPFKTVDEMIANCHYYNGKYFFRRNGAYVEKVRKTTGIVHDHVSLKIFFHDVVSLRMML